MPAVVDEEVTTTTDGLERLGPAWQALWQRTPEATPFQSPAWLLPWWRTFGDGDLLTVAVGRGAELQGLLPLYVHRAAEGRKLLPLGIGLSDYLDPLLAPGDLPAVLARLAACSDRFDWWDHRGLRAGSPLLQAPAVAPAWAGSVHEEEPCPVLELAGGPDRLGETVPRARLAKLPYYLRRAERLGVPALERAGSAGEASELLEALFALHAARWAGRGEAGVLADPKVQAFHRSAVPGLLAAGLLCLFGLRIDGRLVAVLYGLADRWRFHAYIGGYDPALPHPGLGALMLGLAIRAAAQEGMREFHFLRGREPYKYAWGATDRPSYGWRLRPVA